MFYPKYSIRENYDFWDREKITKTAVVKFIIEDQTNEMVNYEFRFRCKGGIEITIDKDTLSENSNLKDVYNSTMTQATKCFEITYVFPRNLSTIYDIYETFKIEAEMIVKSISNIPLSFNSSGESTIWPTENEQYQFESSKIHDQVIVPTSVRSPAFMAIISKIVNEYKDDSLPLLAYKLQEVAKTFDLPDLEKISAAFLDFQISNDNFADILRIAVDLKNTSLVNSTIEFISNNQKDLRGTDQWTKLKACPVMMFSVMEKLFTDKDSLIN